MERFKIPGSAKHGWHCSTPADELAIGLFGGVRAEGVTFSHDQLQAFERLYGFDPRFVDRVVEETRAAVDAANAKELAAHEERKAAKRLRYDEKPPVPAPFDEQGIRRFHTAGDYVALLRLAERDGLRLMGLVARHCYGEDPVKVVAALMIDAGYDIDPSTVSWVEGEPDDDERETWSAATDRESDDGGDGPECDEGAG